MDTIDSRGVAMRSKAMMPACFSEMYLPVPALVADVAFAEVSVVFVEADVVAADAVVVANVAVVFPDVVVVFTDASPLASAVVGPGLEAVVLAIVLAVACSVPVVVCAAAVVACAEPVVACAELVVACVVLTGPFTDGSVGRLVSVIEAADEVAAGFPTGRAAGLARQSRKPVVARMIAIPVTTLNANPTANSLFQNILRSIWILLSFDDMVNITAMKDRLQVENMQKTLD